MSIDQGHSFIAIESIGAYRVVAVNANSVNYSIQMELADTSTSVAVGIIQDDVSTNGTADVATAGLARAICGASVSAGAILTWQTATGRVIEVANNTTTAYSKTIGIALYPGDTNSIIQVDVNKTLVYTT